MPPQPPIPHAKKKQAKPAPSLLEVADPSLGSKTLNTKPKPTPKPKQRDMSRSSAPALPKQRNPDLAAQPSRGAQVQPPERIGPPVIPLSKYGVNMSIDEVNDHVDQIAAAHLKKWGYSPSPGMVFDLLKANGIIGGKVNYTDLFGVPTSAREAQSMALARTGSSDDIATLPVVQPKLGDLIKAVNSTVKADNAYFNRTGHAVSRESGSSQFGAMIDKYNAEFTVALSDPKQAPALLHALQKAYEANGIINDPKRVYASALAPVKLDPLLKPAGVGLEAIVQIVQSTVDMPFGFYKIARGVGIDTFDLATIPAHNLLPSFVRARPLGKATHTIHTGEQIAQGMWYDAHHPLTNPGYLAMDIWAVATAGAGTASRLNAAARAESLGGAARALAFKGKPSATELNFGTYTASLPLSDTAIVRIIQQHAPWFGRMARQKNLEAMLTHGYDDVDGIPVVEKLNGGTMHMIAKQKSLDAQIQIASVMTPMTELQRINRWTGWAKGVFDDVMSGEDLASWRELTAKQRFGTEKTLQLIFTNVPDPVNTWRNFHGREIDRLEGLRSGHMDLAAEETPGLSTSDLLKGNRQLRGQLRTITQQIEAHRSQIEAIDLAKEIILNPPKRMERLINRAYEVSLATEKLRREWLGLDEVVAEQHIAEIGARISGEHVIDMGGGLKGTIDRDPTAALRVHEKRTTQYNNAKTRLERAKATDRLHPGRNVQEMADATARFERAENDLAASSKVIQSLRDEARPLRRVIGFNGAVDVEFLKGDLVQLAKKHGANITFSGDHPGLEGVLRSDSFYHPRHKGIFSSTPGQGSMQARVGNTKRIIRDTTHGRDATNDYVTGLHEIGHHVFQTGDDPFFKRTKEWLETNKDNLTMNEKRLEQEAAVTLWAFKNSAEPIRPVVYDQMREFFKSYEEDVAAAMQLRGERGFRSEAHIGPATDELRNFLPNAEVDYAQALADMRAGTPGAAHFTTQPQKYRPELSPAKRFATRAKYGLRPQKYLYKMWTGTSIEMGDFRWDMSNLLSEQFESAYHAAQVRVQWQDLWDAAVEGEVPPSSRHMPIRDIESVPDELKTLVQALDQTRFDQHFADLLRGDKLRDMKKHLYPSRDELIGVANPHVKWVDENLIMDKVGRYDTQFWRTLDHAVGTVMTPINEPMRLALIFATPAYALNALGSAALLLVQDGFLSPLSLGRSMGAKHFYGPEVTRLLDRLAGQTHASALVSEKGLLTKGSQALQNSWQVLTDTHFRRAAVIHELRRNGILREHMSNAELYEHLTNPDPATQRGINQAAQTGRKAMLDFNQMSWPERATLRHIFFVYSFVRSSTIWSLRFLRDHGVQSDVLAQAGKDREKNIDTMIGKMPDWFMRSGYFAVHPDVIYNPIQWNMPGMLAQTATPVASVFGDVPYSSAAELLGPAAQLGVETLTGKDTQGNDLPGHGGSLERSLLELWQQAPIGRIGVKNAKAQRDMSHPLAPPSVRSGVTDPIGAALSSERSGVNQSVFENDGWWNTWGQAIFRSGITRHVNAAAGTARYWRDLRKSDPAAYHKHEMDAVIEMVKRQSKVLNEPVPGEVVRAVDTIAHVSQAIEDYKLKHTGEPTPNAKTINQITLNTLIAEGHIDKAAKAHWMERIKSDLSDQEVNATRQELLWAGGGKPWKEWVDRVNAVDNYATPRFDATVNNIAQAGLGDYSNATKAPREQRWAYGRKSEAILKHSHELAAAASNVSGDDAYAKQQEWVQYVNANDHETTIKGVTYPSPFAYEFAGKTPEQQVKAVAIMAKRKPSTLTNFQSQILTGSKPDPIVSKAWKQLYQWLKEAKAAQPFGKKLPAGTKRYWEDYIAGKVPEFKTALAEERAPLAIRMATYRPIINSPNAEAWSWLLRQAANRYKQLASIYVDEKGQPRQSLITEQWQHDVPTVKKALEERYGKRFTSELAVYTGATSAKDSDVFLTKFLNRLVAP